MNFREFPRSMTRNIKIRLRWLNYWEIIFWFSPSSRIHHVPRPPTTSRIVTAAASKEKAARHQQWRWKHDSRTGRPGADRDHALRRRWTAIEVNNRAGRGRLSQHKRSAIIRTINSAATLSYIASRRRLHGHATACRRTNIRQRTSHHPADDFACKFNVIQSFESSSRRSSSEICAKSIFEHFRSWKFAIHISIDNVKSNNCHVWARKIPS